MRGIHLSEVARRLGIELEGELRMGGAQIDSRLVEAGDLFFALAGEKVDGHRFLKDVAQKGAIAAVVSKSYAGEDFGLALLRVDDVLLALQELARIDRVEKPIPLVGVTGSVGKTTTKEFLATLLEGKFRTGKSLASFNSKRTLPISVLNMTGEEQVLVLEMAMSEPGDMDRLVEIASPDVAVITKIGLAHAALFPDGVLGIAREKAKIVSSKTKTAIIDYDFLQYPEVVEGIKAEKVTFSIHDPAADYYLSFAEGVYRIDERGVRAYRFDLPFKEAHFLHNFTGALAAARKMGMEWEEIERQVPRLQLPRMRFEQFEKAGIWFINDAYNANPTSVRAALESLPEPKEGGKRIAVLAPMAELGPFSREEHAEIGRLAQKKVDVLLCLHEETLPLCEAFQEAKKPAELFLDHKSLAEKLKEIMRPGDVVLLKGKRTMQMEKVLELLDVVADR